MPGTVVPDTLFLFWKYAATPICYGSGEQDNAAAIVHTSGTTDGIHKPVPLSDKGLNAAVFSLLKDENFGKFARRIKTLLAMELATSYGLVESMHLPLAFGGTTIAIPLGRFNDQIFRAVSDYETNVSFMSARVVDEAIKKREYPDFSSLEYIFLGGYSISAETKERVNRYFKKCGASVRASNGYGISEAGGACIVASPDREDDAIGYPLPGVKVKIYDEDGGVYYNVEDGPRTGVLYISSASVSSGVIDDVTFFRTEEIDGERYLPAKRAGHVQP